MTSDRQSRTDTRGFETVPGATILLLALVGLAASASEPADPLAEARALVARFSQALQSELLAALERGGPTGAIEVCKVEAPAIAARLGATGGWQVGRTSLKVRNPANRADAWERRVLEEFERRHAEGAPPEQLERLAVVAAAGGERLRYMRAIPTGGLCLACHGERLDPEVAAALDRLYPQDQARGFRTGSLRGAFTLSRPFDRARSPELPR